MKRWSLGRLLLTIGGSVVLWAGLGAACLLVGSTGSVGIPTWGQFQWRVESVLLASLIGAALAAAGVVYQAILRNPLADPYLLGVSSGASLFAYLWQFRFAGSVAAVWVALTGRAANQQVFAFLGAALSVMVVFGLASRRGRMEPITLLLVGVIVNAVNGALFLLINALYKDQPGSGGALNFLIGGIQTTLTTQDKAVAAVAIAGGWVALMSLSGPLGVASLSESEAESLGVRIHALRWVSLILASLMTASAVAISGPIGFVGLVCPHLGRLIAGGDPRKLLPVATGLGAGLLAVADAASRYLAGEGYARTLLPVGVLTGLLGGPFFLVLLWQSRRRGLAEVGR
ncbi:MAG: FecCD family ABC transporter permease [Bacillota bacterium]